MALGGESQEFLEKFEERQRSYYLKLQAALKIFIFGPYRRGCLEVLEDLRDHLKSRGYAQAQLAKDLGIPRDPKESDDEYNWRCSRHALEAGDAFIFLFLERRGLLNALQVQDLNQGVTLELGYLLDRSKGQFGIAIFEEGVYRKVSSIIRGRIGHEEFRFDKYKRGDLSSLYEKAESFCSQRLEDLEPVLRTRIQT